MDDDVKFHDGAPEIEDEHINNFEELLTTCTTA